MYICASICYAIKKSLVMHDLGVCAHASVATTSLSVVGLDWF